MTPPPSRDFPLDAALLFWCLGVLIHRASFMVWLVCTVVMAVALFVRLLMAGRAEQ